VSTWKLLLEYDGTRYSGWQEQKNARTVQGALRQASEECFRARVELQGAGRTDAGVHAEGQVAHLRLPGRVKHAPADVRRALNSALPTDIVVLAVEEASGRFHARHDALSRTYRYQLSRRKTAFRKKYVWWVKEPLDVAAMARAARLVEGRHDFRCFRAPDPSRPGESTVVVVESAAIDTDADLVLFRIRASHFLWRMVRRLAGTLVRAGRGEITEAEFQGLLEGRCDGKLDVAAWTAPASGLFLESVHYRV
jgi:tRNA pseudouridine38-40 synthase